MQLTSFARVTAGAAFMVAGLVIAPAVASAADSSVIASASVSTVPVEVLETTTTTGVPASVLDEGVGGGTTPAAVLDENVSNGALAFTGSDVAELALIAAGSVLVGSALLAARRRTRNA